MGMFHSTSGKWGYNYHQRETSYELSKENAILLLKEEQRLRRLSATQRAYTLADTNFSRLEKITHDLQKEALRNVLGIKDSDPIFGEALIAFRNLRAIYRNDPDINQLTDYFKYDISRDLNPESVDLDSIKIVDLLEYYDFDKEINNYGQMPSSAELVANNTKTLGQFLRERNTKNLPVALIGSSYSCPPFRQHNGFLFEELFQRFKEKVFVVTIYIKEAHACDQWKLGNKININQHQSSEERVDATKLMMKEMDFRIPTIVDSIENGYEEAFAVWPEKFVIMNNEGKVFYQSKPETYGHSPHTFRTMIENHLEDTNQTLENTNQTSL